MPGQESQIEQQQIQSEAEAQSTEKQQEAAGTESSSEQSEVLKRVTALEAQLERERERSASLERSLQIQERFLESRGTETTTKQPDKKDEGWTQELDVLDKALDPIFGKRLKTVVDPLTQGYGALRDDNDALRFEMFLQRNNPELLEDEDSYNKVMQQVEAVRQAARTRGMNVSRVDAFVFNEGLQGTKQKITQRKQRRTTANTQESRRTAEVNAAQATSTTSEVRVTANAGIQAIREKANRGERLSDAERIKLKEFVSGVEL